MIYLKSSSIWRRWEKTDVDKFTLGTKLFPKYCRETGTCPVYPEIFPESLFD